MKKVVIIPARFKSSRLPGKPLKDICGKPMVIRVCEAVDPKDFDLVCVATDSADIAKVIEDHGYQAIMTKEEHVSGTDRLFEASLKLGLEPEDIIINLQGDEPLMPNQNLTQVANLLESNAAASVATLYEEVGLNALTNPNIVKLVSGNNDQVLYFSRAPIPFDRDSLRDELATVKRHVGLYAYRQKALVDFVSYKEGSLEYLEKLEQLRFMENGHQIVAVKASAPIPTGVDTELDLAAVRGVFEARLSS